MLKYHSFKEYVKIRFYSDLYEAAENYVLGNYDDLYLPTKHVTNIGRVELEDATIERVFVNDLPDTRISFDVGLSLDLNVFEKTYGSYSQDDCTAWVRITCEGDLSKALDDFEILEIVPYEVYGNTPKSLSDTLIPYIREDKLDQIAEELLEKYYPEALVESPVGKPPILVDPMVLASRIGLSVINRRIREDASIFGQLFFSDADAQFYAEDEKKMVNLHIKRNTIVVDPMNYLLRNMGSVGNTIVHECVHYLIHRKVFLFEKLCNSDVSHISCEVVGGAEIPSAKTMTASMEWQANQLAPRMQMPARTFKVKARESITFYMREMNAKHECDVMEYVINILAESFGVSKQAAKIRLVQLGFDNAIGTYTFLDGHYVKPHGFRKGALKPTQTFSISAQDAAIERFRNPILNELTKNGDYLFIDNHFVYYAPLYVRKGESGSLELTDYARAHMEECCLLFDLSIGDRVSKEYHTVCCLNREPGDYTFEIRFHNEFKNSPQEKQIEMRRQEAAEWIKIRGQLTDNPMQCLEVLIKWRDDISEVSLAAESGLSPRTIRRMKKDGKGDFKSVVRICFGLHLPPILSEKLLDVFGCKLIPLNQEHLWIKEALALMYPQPIEEVVSYLSTYGVCI